MACRDVGCWLFAEWKIVDDAGEVVKDGSTEASDASVRLLPEDREDLKTAVLEGKLEYEVKTKEGPQKLSVDKGGVSLKSKYLKATTVSDLYPEVRKLDTPASPPR